MKLDEAAVEMRRFADENPYTPQGVMTCADPRYKREVEHKGHTVEACLVLFVVGGRGLYELSVATRDVADVPLNYQTIWEIKDAILPTATEVTQDGEGRRKYILAK